MDEGLQLTGVCQYTGRQKLSSTFCLTKPDYRDELSHPSSLLRRKRFEEKYIKEFDEEIKLEIKRKDPGYILYEDDYQVSTVPHGNNKPLAK